MNRDNDVIRAVGYVTIQASHLEGVIEEIAEWLGAAVQRPQHHETARISEKIKWCKSAIRQLNSAELTNLVRSLDKAENLFIKRNELVHGRIYFDDELPEILVPTKAGKREKYIAAPELYDLAESIYNLHIRILSENSFKLVAALSKVIEA
ncbi:hypothetical protein CBP51_14295 [Cellvibrio mixtus]|uniref:Uncharacterized protein n=1 Tax=Cellvibrio mixtus TaxID=39650 RepID=A0A266Q3D4_9GAMM|nr:hypothetical protein [Cellvibrio mixtus]OZY84378.1 hypothetical protein CBP51_14295 [Cellvibrio mixtus]